MSSVVKTWNVYAIEKRRGRWVVKFVGEIEAKAKAIRRAAQKVSRQARVTLEIRDAQTDTWRRPAREAQIPRSLAR